MKVITICGSLKFMSDMIAWSEKLEFEGNCVLPIIYPTREDKDAYTAKELEMFAVAHKKKIDLSDAIFVVNKNGYIGSGVKSEIEYAKANGKEILFMES
jgi:hypothetical protein